MGERCFLRSPTIVLAGLALLLAGWLCAAAPASGATQTWSTPVFGGYNWVVPDGIATAMFPAFA
jgi:hypothetical protein